MNKYFVIYRVPVATMEDWLKNTPAEERQKQGAELGEAMTAWNKKHEKQLVERGWPLGKTKTVTKDAVKDSRNDLNYCCIVEAESHDAAAAMFKDSPHFAIPESYIDIMEIPNMGM